MGLNRSNAIVGTCDGTGALIKVSLGFKPRAVRLLNIDSNTIDSIEWQREMELIASNAHEGVKSTGTSSVANAILAVSTSAQQGIREYAGGEKLTYDLAAARWEDESGNDVTEVNVNGHYERDTASSAAFQDIGDAEIGDATPLNGQDITTPPGFSIGVDSDVNVNGQQLSWIAFR